MECLLLFHYHPSFNPHSRNKPCLLSMAELTPKGELDSIPTHSRPPARMTGCYSVCVCVCVPEYTSSGEVDKFPALIRTHRSSFHLFYLSPFSNTFALPSSSMRNHVRRNTCPSSSWFRDPEKDVSCSPDFPNDNVARHLPLFSTCVIQVYSQEHQQIMCFLQPDQVQALFQSCWDHFCSGF